MVNKNKTEDRDRNRLDIEGSLWSILAVKLESPESISYCLDYDPDDKFLQVAKRATVNYDKRVTG